jgi:predicted metalloprotease with PDZ domain
MAAPCGDGYCPPMPSVPPIGYHVAMPDPASHELHVTMEVPALLERASLDLVFPAWAPGSYLVRDFVRHMYDLRVTDERGRALPVERVDKLRYRVASGGRAVRARYRIFAFEQSVRTSFLDESHAFWNGTSVFFFVDGELGRPCRLTVAPRRGWQVSTALDPAPGRNVFAAASYDELADSPVEVGTHQRLAFQVPGARFEVAFYGRTNATLARLVADLRRIVTATGRLFGGFPFDRYLFIIHALPARGGGLEHARSATLDIAGLSFDDEKGYHAFAELAAHEFFHAWNVKRIHDRVLGPFDYTRENYTRLLWFHEGFTEYMESLILLRAGLLSPKAYLEELAESWGKYLARPGRNVTPLAELSFEAWIKLYKPADNHTNRTVSYYEKGKWAGLVLDLLMREASGGRQGVAELFRRLWRDFGETGKGLEVADIRAAAEELAGRSLRTYFSRYIEGTDELPVPALLRRAAVEVERRATWSDEEDPIRARRQRSWSGLTFAPGSASSGDRAVVRNVVPGSPAWRAGLTFGDEVVAVDGIRVGAGSVNRRLADHPPGERARLTFFRQDLLRTASFALAESPDRSWDLSLAIGGSTRARAIRRRWIGA